MTAIPHALEDLTPQQLVAEIRQISSQYQSEVSTKRRTWPASIRDRVMALKRQGVNPYRIAELSSVPYTTILCWSGRSKPKRKARVSKSCGSVAATTNSDGGRFLPVLATENMTTEPTTVVPTTVRPTAVVGLTVVLPGGLEVRGLASVAQVAELYRSLGAGART
jgi:hypothetical protein